MPPLRDLVRLPELRPRRANSFRRRSVQTAMRGLPFAGQPAHSDAGVARKDARLLRTLNYGAMIAVAYTMSLAEREAVAKYLGVAGGDAPMPASAFCRDRAVKIAANSKVQWNGWSPTTDNWRYQSADAAGLTLDGVKRLKLKWAFALAGDVTAFAQPTILDNDLFMGSASGETTHRAAAVELLRHRNEAHASLVEHLHNAREVQQRTAEPVDLVHHHPINPPGFAQQLPQCGPVGVGSREAAIVIAVRQHRPFNQSHYAGLLVVTNLPSDFARGKQRRVDIDVP